ncbi:helix-turn-helix domain-containing protein [Glaciecola sp. MH2013]|uniref:AraC family transcriptional regulator n=1 Tax=Glaciecola sp. MH2013 TaxID=2785524 RepID=UPI0018A0F2B2|nr:AraC family transcriptional regulator [Glaciecola sp. MH2013]MBF7072951.1 helix-turn-helix domain-containing protein [Glaciecola sp. MH2013]
MRKHLSLPTYYFGHVIAVLKSAGVQVDKWLASQDLNMDELTELDARVSVERFDALMKVVIENHGFEDFGISVGKRLELAHHGDFGLAVLNCASLKDVLDFHNQFISIRLPFVSFDYKLVNATVKIELQDKHWQMSLHRSVTEAICIAIVNMLHSINFQDASKIEILSASFDYSKPSYVAKYEAMKAKELKFEQAICSITFSDKYLQRALAMVDEFSFQRAIARCKKELEGYQQHTHSTKDAVYSLLCMDQGCTLSLEQVAERLFMSKRTLHRSLEAEGTSFKALLQKRRSDEAKRLLLIENMSISNVADELGYSDAANFRRAFKTWYGLSPRDWLKSKRG